MFHPSDDPYLDERPRRRWGLNAAILLTVAYDGRPFAGWAPQRDTRTVAGELLGALRSMDPEVRELRGASRTDAGVHARGQIAVFQPSRPIPPRGWVLGLSRHLPAEIAVRSGGRIADDFGSDPPNLFGRVVRKRYRYLLIADQVRDPFWDGRALRIADAIDWPLVAREAACAVGTHDFAAFRSSGDHRESTVRNIEAIEIRAQRDDPRVTSIDVTGNAFLYNMVRILVGTLLDVGRGRLAEGAIAAGLESRRRESLGFTAPAHGLYLEEVTHTLRLDDCWPA